jgi:hypothetical protein
MCMSYDYEWKKIFLMYNSYSWAMKLIEVYNEFQVSWLQ